MTATIDAEADEIDTRIDRQEADDGLHDARVEAEIDYAMQREAEAEAAPGRSTAR